MSEEFDEMQIMLRFWWKRYRRLVGVLAVVVLVTWAGGSVFYKVEADSAGVVLRLGKIAKQSGPGLHFKWPWPIDTVYIVPVELVQSTEFGYRTRTPGRRTQYAPSSEQDRTMARMLTADLNLAHVEWVVQYRIQEPEDYLFRIGGDRRANAAMNARDLIRDVSEAVMRRIIGDVSVDSVITTGREKIADDAKVEMQEILNGFAAGIKVVAVKLQSATPPEKVKDAFDAVNRAKQRKETVVNQAKGERNRLIPAARGARDRAIAEAEGYEVRVKMEAQGRAHAFLAKLAEFEKAPQITEMRLYLEAMEEILAQVDGKTIIDESIKGVLPLLHIGAGTTGMTPPGSSDSARKGGGR